MDEPRNVSRLTTPSLTESDLVKSQQSVDSFGRLWRRPRILVWLVRYRVEKYGTILNLTQSGFKYTTLRLWRP